MCPISDKSRSTRHGQISWNDGDITDTAQRKREFQDLINKANTVPLNRIFRYYNLRLDGQKRNMICPFSSHKGGRENTPSFYYYPETNSFYCFGCSVGGKNAHGTEFIALLENITRTVAAKKIIQYFSGDIGAAEELNDTVNLSERLEILISFSNKVRGFRQTHYGQDDFHFIENICWVFDEQNNKHKHTNEALKRLVEMLSEKIDDYNKEI